jgi:DNA-binding LacI/PurR family transcriptional regulator
MVLFAPRSEADVERLDRYIADGHVAAVLLLAMRDSELLLQILRERAIPVVASGRPRSAPSISSVDVDNHSGGREATEHLIAQGRRRIAHIAGSSEGAAGAQRLQGYREAMWKAALNSDLIEPAEGGRDAGEMAMHRLLAQTHRIDAVFAASDSMAAGALWALQVLGIRVPEDVALIGFDNSPIATTTRPQLSSVHQPIEAMGREMARLALSPAANGHHASQEVVLPVELAIRYSTVGAATTPP